MRQSCIIALCVILQLTLGCASAPKRYLFDNSATVKSEFDKSWEAVISYFATKNISIKTLEKASGIIAAEVQAFPKDWIDCGKAGFGATFLDPPSGAFNVFVREVSDGTCEIQVNANFTIEKLDTMNNRSAGRVSCNSTGEFEAALLQYVYAYVSR